MEEQLPSRRGTDNLVVAIRGQFATTWLSPRRRGHPSPPSGRVPWAVRGRHFLRAGRTVRAGLEVRGARCPTDRGGPASASPRDLGEHGGHEPGPAPLDRPAEGLVVLSGAPRLARRARSPGQWSNHRAIAPTRSRRALSRGPGPSLVGMRRGNCARLGEPRASRSCWRRRDVATASDWAIWHTRDWPDSRCPNYSPVGRGSFPDGTAIEPSLGWALAREGLRALVETPRHPRRRSTPAGFVARRSRTDGYAPSSRLASRASRRRSLATLFRPAP